MITSKNQAGYLIVYTLILVFGLMSVGLVALSVVGATYKFTKDDAYRKNASYMARACVSVVANELTEDPAFSGFSPASQVLYDRTGVNGGIASCIVDSITDGDGNARIVQLTSYIHRYSGDPNPIQFQARAVLDAQEGQFGSHMEGGILVGNGGMYSDRTGDITTPQMNLLGRLNKSGTGNYNVEDNGVVYVHNIGCGTSLDWPQHCTGQDPILTPGTGNIYGDICAPGQSDTSKLRYLNPSCTLPAMTMPAFDKAGFVSGLGGPIISPSTILGNGGCYTVSGSRNNGTTYTVPAGATIAGTLDLRTLPELYAAGTCRISFQGNAYIEGGIIGNDAEAKVNFTVDDAVADNITVVMNGQMSSNEPTLFSFTANASGKIAHIINFNSSNAAYSNSDTIPSSTVNTCLSTSEARTTATSTSYAGLNIDGTGTKDLSGATFYAYYGMAIVNGSGIFDIAALAAQGLNSSGTGDFTLTSDNPTFGVPVPSNSEDYHVVDFVQR